MTKLHPQIEAQNPAPPSRTKNIIVPIAIILAGILGFVGLASMAQKPEKKEIDISPPLVKTNDIEVKDVVFEVTSQGTVKARTETVMISEVSGQITFVSEKLRVGGYFSKGELMLEIDPIVYEVNLLEAQSRLESMQAEFIQEQARSDQAKEEWRMTGKPLDDAPILALRTPQLQKARADVKASQADLKEAQTKLERTKIYAPYDALLVEKYVDIGQYVSIGGQLAKTFAIDYAEVRLPVKQSDLRFLNLPKVNEIGDTSRPVKIIYHDGFKVDEWSSFIARYEGVVNNESRVHYIVAQIDDPYNLKNREHDDEVRIGMFVNAIIQGKKADNIVVVPREAIHGTNVLHIIDANNKLKVIEVEVVRAQGEDVYVKNNFSAGDRIVMTSLRTPVQGMPLRVEGEQVAAIKPEPDSE